jgi:hypothetical protein
MSKVISAKVDNTTEKDFTALAARQGKTKSSLVKDLILKRLREPSSAVKPAPEAAEKKAVVYAVAVDSHPKTANSDDAQHKAGDPPLGDTQGRHPRSAGSPDPYQPVDGRPSSGHERLGSIHPVKPLGGVETWHHHALDLHPDRRCPSCLAPGERRRCCSGVHRAPDQQ